MNAPTILLLRRNSFLAQTLLHLAAGVLALLLCTGVSAHAQEATVAPARPDRLLVKPLAGADLAALNAALGTTTLNIFPDIGGLEIVQLPAAANATDLIAAYRQSGLVEYAEPDYLVRALADPNDFRYWDGTLWGLRNTGIYGGTPGADIKAAQGWDVQNSAASIIVAVTDTGARLSHEDLAGNLWTNPGESGRTVLGLDKGMNGIDDDGDGYVDDVHGINVLLGTGLPADDYGHGTHVSGTIGGVGNNSVGVVGVAWRVQLMECKFIDSAGHGSISDAITCLNYARQKGARIVNASWGDYGFNSTALYDAIDSLRRAGILFVAACGNDNTDNDARPLYPASYNLDNIIAVAATDRTDAKAWFSNYGARTVHLGAPGAGIFSAWNGSDSDYRYYDGTSMAAPQVAGACALVWAHFPTENYRQIRSRILASTDPLPSLFGRTVTGGRLNLYRALTSSSNPPPSLPVVTIVASDPNAAEAGSDPGVFTVTRTGSTKNSITVCYALDGTAQNGTDYQTLSGAVTIPAGANSATVTVRPIDDSQVEGTETVVATLSANSAYAVGSAAQASVSIADNDSNPPPPSPLPLPLPI
ncbi:MAG: S8 family serine peptidase [Opitutae bacterium]|nr:S8 family serine peptidase [Opitutae bacterium]